MEQNTVENESMPPPTYIFGLKLSKKMYLLQILVNTLWSSWM